MNERVKEKTIEILANQSQLKISEITMESTLENLGIDSVGVVEIIFAIEEEFEITIPYNANETSFQNLDFSKVSSIVTLVSSLVSKNQ